MDDVIKRSKVKLIKWLRGDTLVLQHMQSGDIITDTEYNKLKETHRDDERNSELLDTIRLKGPATCCKFLNLLKEKDVNDELNPELREWLSKVDTSDTSEASVASGVSTRSSANDPNSSTSPAGKNIIEDNEKFLRNNRSILINNVKNVVGIVDDLLLKGEMRSNVQAEPTDEARMRMVLDFTKSKKAAEVLIKALWKHAGDIMEELTSEA